MASPEAQNAPEQDPKDRKPFDLDAVLAGLSPSVGKAFDLIGEATTPEDRVAAALATLMVASDEGASDETKILLLEVTRMVAEAAGADMTAVPEMQTLRVLRRRFVALLERQSHGRRNPQMARSLLTIVARTRGVRDSGTTRVVRSRQREHRSSRSRRVATATSSASSGDDGPGEPSPSDDGQRWPS